MLTSLRLERFKNFRDATLPMGPLTVLVGTNAAGKSNLREALRFLHGISRGYALAEIIGEKWAEGGILQWRGIRGGTGEATFEGTRTFALEAGFALESGRGTYRIEVDVGENGKPPCVVAEKLVVGSTSVFDSHPKDDPLETSDPDPDHLPVRLMKGGARGRYGRRLNCLNLRPAISQVAENTTVRPASAREKAKQALQMLSSMRFLDLEPESLRRPSLPGQTVLGDKGENLSSVLQAICVKPERKAALASWIAELTPMDATDFIFPSDQTGRILVSLVEKDGRPISAYSASDGTLRFLAMIAALLGPDPSRFYFFEELDNGIHPARLGLLLSLIERETEREVVQMVATTHSPELLALLKGKTLENASLIYRLPHSHEGRVKRILDIPEAADLIGKQSLARLHATGWFEHAVYLSSEDEELES